MLEWLQGKGVFPAVLLLRRYTKLVARYCDNQGLLDLPMAEAVHHALPYRIELLPYFFPDLSGLALWVAPKHQQ